MGEDRRLKIAKRQLTLAHIAQREARYSLANALAQEERSAQLHERSQHLLREYETRILDPDVGVYSHNLQANLAFVRSLQTMTQSASDAQKDARDQAEYQMRTLAAAETRMDAHTSRVREEKRALDALRERREVPPELTMPTGVARKLQTHEQNGEEAARKRGR